MDKRYREAKQAIRAVAKGYGVQVSGPEHLGNTHLRWRLTLGDRQTTMSSSCSPRCNETMVRKVRSEARRACESLIIKE